MHRNTLLGPLSLGEGVDVESYLQLLRDMLELYVDEMPLALRRRFYKYFQQNSTPHNFAGDGLNLLNEVLPGRWTGRRGPFGWPPRFPNFMPLYIYTYIFFPLWSHPNSPCTVSACVLSATLKRIPVLLLLQTSERV